MTKQLKKTIPTILSTCKQILEAAARTSGVLLEPPAFATLVEFDNSAITYRIHFFINRVDQQERIEDRVRTNMWYRLKRAGISVPFPIRNINVHEVHPDGDEAKEQDRLQSRVRALTSIPFLAPLNNTFSHTWHGS